MPPTTTGPRERGSRLASPSRARRRGLRRWNARPEKRVAGRKTAPGIFWRNRPETHPENATQTLGTHQATWVWAYDFAPGCAVAPNSTDGLIAASDDGIYSDGSIPWVSQGGEAAAAGKRGVLINNPRLLPGGVLTLGEANRHYREGHGTPLTVYARNYDFSGVDPNGFNPVTGRQLYRFPATSAAFFVFGTVTLQRDPGGETFRVLPDTYDFDMHPWTQQPVRNVATLAGEAVATQGGTSEGTPYPIIFRGYVDMPPQQPHN